MKFFNPKFLLLMLIVGGVTFGGLEAGLATNTTQALTLAVFASVISTTPLFWERRGAAHRLQGHDAQVPHPGHGA